MSKNLLETTHDYVQKLARKTFQENNSLYTEKVENFCYKYDGIKFEKNFNFYGILNSIMDIDVQINVNNIAQFIVILNNVIIHKNQISSNYFLSSSVYLKEFNELKIIVDYGSETGMTDITLTLKINIKNINKNLIKMDIYNEKIYFIKNNIMSISDNILSLTNNINNANIYQNDIMCDINFNYNNSNNLKNKLITIYNDSINYVLHDVDSDMKVILDNDIDSCCILSSIGDEYNVVHVCKGEIFLKNYDNTMTIKNTYKLKKLSYLNIVKIKSISSDTMLQYFLVKSKNGTWYLIDIEVASGTIFNIRNIAKCEDIGCYFYNGKFYIFQLVNEGVNLEVFNTMGLSEKLYSYEFKNSSDAFYCDGIYLVNNSVVQKVEM